MQFTSRSASTAFLTLLFCSLSLFSTAHAASKDDWRSRSIYQLITDRFARTDLSTDYPCNTTEQLYCGGTFQGIINNLDYIQGMGFTAIWISPVVKNINETTKYGQGYHGFWIDDIYVINPLFGSSDNLKNLSAELHKRDMYLMIDVIVNDMASAGWGNTTDYSKLTPFDKEEYYHPFCWITEWDNMTNVEDCWLGDDVVALADLDTTNAYVISTWESWVSEMVANYSLDGLRIDAAKHIDKPFWPLFQEAAGVFTIGEVYDADASSACYWAVDALDSVLNYPNWYYIVSILGNSSNSMGGLEYEFANVATECHDSTLLGTFSENHDVPRFGSVTSDLSQQKNALTFDFMSDGIPTVYYGAEQRFSGADDPHNREALWLAPGGYNTDAPLYQHIKALNKARTAVGDYLTATNYSGWSAYWAYKAQPIYVTNDIVVLRKGYVNPIVSAFTNVGVDGAKVGPYNVSSTNFIEGIELIEVLNCTSTKVGYGGSFNITLVNGEPQVWVPGALLVNTTDLCVDLIEKVTDKVTTSGTATVVSSAPTVLTPSYMISSLICSIAAVWFIL